MAEGQNTKESREKRTRFEENVPSTRILKLAILAAAIIAIIAIIVYLKARHAPPALQNELGRGTARIECAEMARTGVRFARFSPVGIPLSSENS